MIVGRARIAAGYAPLLEAAALRSRAFGADVAPLVARIAPAVLLAGIGVELALLTAFLPQTLDRFLFGPPADFHNLYAVADKRDVPGLYSPFLVVLFFPLTLLGEMAAFRAFFVVNTICVAGIALIAQRPVRSLEAKTLVALAPFALPQMHWALRLGHLTPVIALVALSALVVIRTHPRRGALLLALLSLKPQYLIAPIAYLVWRREIRLIAIVVASSALLAAAGFALIGPGGVGQFIAYYVDWGPNSTDNLLPVQQSWMVSWTGVQISFGHEAHPLVAFDLILLSLAIACFAWARLREQNALAVVALMFIPLTPYAQFYDAALILVALALLLRTDLADATKALLCACLYAAAIATQASVPFPVKDVLGPAATHGAYWLTPALVACAAFLAIRGGPPPLAQEAA